MSIDLRRRNIVLGSATAVALAQLGLASRASAQSAKLASVPTVDSLTIRVITDSSSDTPPLVELVELPAHRVVRVLEDNQALRARAAAWITRKVEFLKLAIPGGVEMDAWLLKPPDFDPANKYPVFVFLYGEPHLQRVTDDWSGGGQNLFSRAIADAGYLVVSIDNRGTPAPKGAAWRRAVYGSLPPFLSQGCCTNLSPE